MGMIKQGKIYVDRHDAGFEVAKLLEPKYKDQDILVLGIPRGGVIVAYEVARILNAQLSIVITKKLPHPDQPELAIGAIAEDGSVYLTSLAGELSHESVKRIVARQREEIQSRIKRFRAEKPIPEMHNRIVVLTDDGIATGSTLVPAIKLCIHRRAQKIIVAAPVSGAHYASEIDELADEVVIAEQPEMLTAVGQVYEDFHHVSDAEVIQVLQEFTSA